MLKWLLFKVVHKDVDFVAWGGRIYVRPGADLKPHNKAHEETHLARQETVGKWRWLWRYLTDKEFKKAEEVLAFRAEVKAGGNVDDCAELLASDSYRLNLTVEEARCLLF